MTLTNSRDLKFTISVISIKGTRKEYIVELLELRVANMETLINFWINPVSQYRFLRDFYFEKLKVAGTYVIHLLDYSCSLVSCYSLTLQL